MRKTLIDKIIETSGEELTKTDLIEIAKETRYELLERLINILDYYIEENNN